MALWSILRPVGIFLAIWYIFDNLVYFVVIWYIFPRLGILHQEKSGNPGAVPEISIKHPQKQC
jgi:hypothetical protein